ncbi:MAG: TlpA family protein disulfide reductase, partial [Planctomycetales bacterium]|nr:TlpA family protein disulfide reductase [Planctomycetales bacterium]
MPHSKYRTWVYAATGVDATQRSEDDHRRSRWTALPLKKLCEQSHFHFPWSSLIVRKFPWLAIASVVIGIGCITSAVPSRAADLLTIGSQAPPLDVEHWVQDGNGKFKPVTKFDKGKVYVVEFWATWCGPCVASMPHLAALQTELADKGVQIVSISNEELETVEKFLEREVRSQDEEAKPQTYRQLTSAYCLTTDPD